MTVMTIMAVQSDSTEGTGGEYLRQLRYSRSLSLRELAKKSGLSASYISLLENDLIENPSKESILKLAETLEISPELLGVKLFAPASDMFLLMEKISDSHELQQLIQAALCMSEEDMKELKDSIIKKNEQMDPPPDY